MYRDNCLSTCIERIPLFIHIEENHFFLLHVVSLHKLWMLISFQILNKYYVKIVWMQWIRITN